MQSGDSAAIQVSSLVLLYTLMMVPILPPPLPHQSLANVLGVGREEGNIYIYIHMCNIGMT